ncbi:unnamed protein product [Cylindrotheca closterium]|uniref:Uncharacterized protein n=1 Tax=Cylindrotheca closterium TaxID=2856 RepID=A0AAD2G5Z0_9STRA|nr:unnamed protein product [Cylindrotheca closterium]
MTESMTPDQIEFTNAFNRQRVTLAGFAQCANKEELHKVRDGLYIGLASDLRLPEYDTVATDVIVDERVADSVVTGSGYGQMIETARESAGWKDLVDAVDKKAEAVGSDLQGIWMGLENGRLEWLNAINGAHTIKVLLKEGLEKDGATNSPGDVSDAKMIWIYGLCLNIPKLKPFVEAWCKVVELDDMTRPLVGYKADLWDARKDEWRALDIGAQVAAERGGSSIDQAWNA